MNFNSEASDAEGREFRTKLQRKRKGTERERERERERQRRTVGLLIRMSKARRRLKGE